MNSSVYHQIAKANIADRVLAAERDRIARAIRPARKHHLAVGLRDATVTRRVRALARLRTA